MNPSGAAVTPGVQTVTVPGYRFPDGVEFLGDSDGEMRMTVSMPTDEEGFYGRECPSCELHFRIWSDDYESLPDDQTLWCVYCGHRDDDDEFTTAQQMDRLERAVTDYAEQLVSKSLDKAFRRMARRSRGSMVEISYHSEPFRPTPLPGISEERLIRERSCPSCGVRYAVFGEHRFCPTCGQLPALAVALDSLAADATRLDSLADSSPETHAELRESGVLDRTYVDTIENAVGIVETLAKRLFEDHVPDAQQVLRQRRGSVFQRLNDLAELFDEYLGIDLPDILGRAWTELQESWAARHVFTHHDGIVDSSYLTAVSNSPLQQGQRLIVTEDMARQVIRDAELLCRSLSPQDPQ